MIVAPLPGMSPAFCDVGASEDFKFEKGVVPFALKASGHAASKMGPGVDENSLAKGEGLVSETEKLFELNFDILIFVFKKLLKYISVS